MANSSQSRSSAPTIAITIIELDDVATCAQPSLTISGTTSGVEDGQHVTVTLDGKSHDTVVTANAWSVSVPVAASVLPDGGYTVTATVFDKAGNRAPPATQTLKRPESSLLLTPEQAQGLEQASKQWTPLDKAIEWIQQRENCGSGYAEKLLETALASREVYMVLGNDKESWTTRDYQYSQADRLQWVHNDELIEWFNRHRPLPQELPPEAQSQPQEPPPPEPPKPRRKRRRPEREVIAWALKGRFPDGIPSVAEMGNTQLFNETKIWFEANYKAHGKQYHELKIDSVLREAGRREDD
jgi:hypothetical protein